MLLANGSLDFHHFLGNHLGFSTKPPKRLNTFCRGFNSNLNGGAPQKGGKRWCAPQRGKILLKPLVGKVEIALDPERFEKNTRRLLTTFSLLKPLNKREERCWRKHGQFSRRSCVVVICVTGPGCNKNFRDVHPESRHLKSITSFFRVLDGERKGS